MTEEGKTMLKSMGGQKTPAPKTIKTIY